MVFGIVGRTVTTRESRCTPPPLARNMNLFFFASKKFTPTFSRPVKPDTYTEEKICDVWCSIHVYHFCEGGRRGEHGQKRRADGRRRGGGDGAGREAARGARGGEEEGQGGSEEERGGEGGVGKGGGKGGEKHTGEKRCGKIFLLQNNRNKNPQRFSPMAPRTFFQHVFQTVFQHVFHIVFHIVFQIVFHNVFHSVFHNIFIMLLHHFLFAPPLLVPRASEV